MAGGTTTLQRGEEGLSSAAFCSLLASAKACVHHLLLGLLSPVAVSMLAFGLLLWLSALLNQIPSSGAPRPSQKVCIQHR
jgi:hypothetical protein